MKLNEDSYEFAQNILKHYGPFVQKKKQIPKIQEEQPILLQKMDTQTKYSLDYEKFKKIIDSDDTQKKLTPEEEEMKKMIDQNPYLSQMACTHDRRKVLNNITYTIFKEREIYDKSNKEKLDNAEFFKNEGNKALLDKEYEKAAYFYQKALIHFDYTFPDSPEENKRFDLLKEQCHNNMAQCKYYQQDFDECLIQCDQVLKMNPQNVKAIFRKAKILLDRDDFQESEEHIMKLLEINNKNTEVIALQQKLKEKKIIYKKCSQKIYKKMFDG